MQHTFTALIPNLARKPRSKYWLFILSNEKIPNFPFYGFGLKNQAI
jgi:hypothetical protein